MQKTKEGAIPKCQKRIWKKMDVQGNLFFGKMDLEGLVGLEIMEEYDAPLVSKRLKNDIACTSKVILKAKRGKKKIHSAGKYVLLSTNEDEPTHIASENCDGTEMSEWSGLGVPHNILRALAEQNFRSPTLIQKLTLPFAISAKKNILGAAETGSGKTLAFGIPILAGIMEMKQRNQDFGQKYKEITSKLYSNSMADSFKKPLFAVILTPTRELAVQVKDHINLAAKYTGIVAVAIFGGMALVKQERVLKKNPEIVVATPGRLWELLEKGNSHLNKIDDISFLAIDETDRMLEKGHFKELEMLINRLKNNKMTSIQHFIFSATLTLVTSSNAHTQTGKKNSNKCTQTSIMKIEKIISELGIAMPEIIDITRLCQTSRTLTESRINCNIDEKDYYLYYFLQKYPGRTIVFCNSIDCVKRLAKLFEILKCSPLALHAQMIQKHRLKNLEKFRANSNGLLISTDVAARGLDIINVHHVVHYQVPRTGESYVHRSGRTARASNSGIAIILMEPSEEQCYLKICKTLTKNDKFPLFPVNKTYIQAVKVRVDLAREIDIMELNIKRTKSQAGWFKKTADAMEIILEDDDYSNDHEDSNSLWKNKRYLQNRKKMLITFLSKPIFPNLLKNKSGYSPCLDQLQGHLKRQNNSENNTAVTAVQDSLNLDNLLTLKKFKNI